MENEGCPRKPCFPNAQPPQNLRYTAMSADLGISGLPRLPTWSGSLPFRGQTQGPCLLADKPKPLAD
eukprot:7100993-Pyramimonas_sp.AAC.1